MERSMNVFPLSVRWDDPFFYLDGVIVFAETTAEHIDHDRLVLNLLKDAGKALKLGMCELFTR